MALPTAIYSTRQVRELDEHAIRERGVAGYTLMKRAGEASLRMMRTRWPMAHQVVIVCGAGNNAGDGYVLARFAQAAGLEVRVLAAADPQRLRGDARRAWQDFVASSGVVQPFGDAAALAAGDVVVDAILGIGLEGPVRPDLAVAIEAVNACGRPVFALDIPSGLSGDTGLPMGVAVRADCTVTFIGLKTGLYLGDGPEYCGTVFFDDLEVEAPRRDSLVPRLHRMLESEIAAALPRRPRAAHKGSFGRVLVIGSGAGMPGATRLAGEAALRVGAGLVTVLAAPESALAVAGGRPELIVHGLEDARAVDEHVARADVIAVGPGLGRSDWARAVFARALVTSKPVIVDADALNLLAEQGLAARDNWVLTPHPGEAGRLLGRDTAAVQSDRLGALEALVARYGGIVVLKGAGTLVGGAGRVAAICERGNPGMAAPGMGDVLTGAIAGIVAQVGDPWCATRVGVLAHAMAGDAEARNGERGLLASEVAQEIRNWVNLQ
ncbi:MAG: NAD(P)H-hydrate dehydratase [Steroidobacteraceae bacterium]|nr:NAD(P)H-hydrate dehydratase [Steroidobacteraceae bacterium]